MINNGYSERFRFRGITLKSAEIQSDGLAISRHLGCCEDCRNTHSSEPLYYRIYARGVIYQRLQVG